MPIEKGIVPSGWKSWQEYRDAIVALTHHLTGKEPSYPDEHYQEAFDQLMAKRAERQAAQEASEDEDDTPDSDAGSEKPD